MGRWEANDERTQLKLLVGDFYGDRPQEKLDVIRAAKKDRAAKLCRRMGCNGESVVLEIGSGMGFTSKHIAGAVKQLHCCDISASFLSIAQMECAGIGNIEFVRIENEQVPTLPFPDDFFDIIFADAVFIHLNLYDIFWYFSEFQRLAKERATVYINVTNASAIDLRKFSEMAGFYRKSRASLDRLLCWNSIKAVVAIAAHFGFRLTLRSRLSWLRSAGTVGLLFRKR